jgi:hypoxanthine phosphoribosyltransferase
LSVSSKSTIVGKGVRRPARADAAPAARPRFTADRIRRKVAALARRIERTYAGTEPVLVGVLKGGFLFLGDLARALSIPVTIDFLRIRSYGAGTAPGRRFAITKDIEIDVAGKDILVVEDIVDTGRSLARIRRHLERKGPRSVRFCVLVDKRERRERDDVTIDFRGFRLKRGFLVGYGMDCAERYRNLPQIHCLEDRRGTKDVSGGQRG